MKKETTELAFGIPVWNLYSCEACGCVLLPTTMQQHSEWHKSSHTEIEPKIMPKDCPVCGETINIPLDFDGSMLLDIYDDHIESHES